MKKSEITSLAKKVVSINKKLMDMIVDIDQLLSEIEDANHDELNKKVVLYAQRENVKVADCELHGAYFDKITSYSKELFTSENNEINEND